MAKVMHDVQFSADGETFTTLISYDNKELAESLVKACAGWLGSKSDAKYWRTHRREAGEPFVAVTK